MEAVEPLTFEKQIENIVGFKNLIDQDTTNDFFLYPFMSMVLNLTDSQGFITELGLKCLFNEINKDFDIINQSPEKPSQKALCRLCLYFTICYNLTIYFGGFILGLETEAGKKYAEKLPAELIGYLKEISERADKLHPILEHQLKGLTSRLTDKYAKIYNEEKRKHWTKDIFQTSVHIPAHPDDYPENYKPENCINIPSNQ
jgi:hypothetical protein